MEKEAKNTLIGVAANALIGFCVFMLVWPTIFNRFAERVPEKIETAAAKVNVPYMDLPAAKDPNTGIELSAQQNPYQFRSWILPAGTKLIYPDGTEKILFEKAFLTMAKR